MNDLPETVTEGYKKATGTLNLSYIMFSESRLVNAYTKAVNEEIRGSRRNTAKACLLKIMQVKDLDSHTNT